MVKEEEIDFTEEMKEIEEEECLSEKDCNQLVSSKISKITSNHLTSNPPHLTNLTNLTNLTSITNLTNLTSTSILKDPENKQEKIFYYLYDNGEQPIEVLIEIGGLINKNAFYQLKNRQSDSLYTSSKKDSVSYYDITPLCRDQIKVKIDHSVDLLKTQKEELSEIDSFNQEREELILDAKNFIESYKSELDSSISSGIFYIDFEKITEISPVLAEQIIEKPDESLQILELAIEELDIAKDVRVRLKNISDIYEKKVETIRSNSLDNLITVKGRIMQLSDVRPQVVNAKFECPSCGTIISVLQIEKKFREPTRCSCGRRGGFKTLSKGMVDSARFILEDLHEKSDNPLSKRINCFIKEDLTNEDNIKKCFPGNEVIITGILKEVPNPLPHGGLSTRVELAIEVNNVELSDDELNINKFTDKEIIQIKELANNIDKNGLSEINKSFCPDVYGHENIKNAIILFLSNKRNDKKDNKSRNKSNICIIGDPGTAKSVICNEAVSLTPCSRKQTGGSASAVGLTASVVKDDYSGGWALQPGALVLAKEFTFIDEINNLGDDEKPKLQEAMSEQEINIAKASIQAKLSVTGGVLACANPKNGIFDPDINIVQQFNLPPAIANRFDLIFVVRDKVDGNNDRQVSKSMIQRHRKLTKQVYNNDLIKKYLFYVRNSEEPEINNDMEKMMIDVYEKIRAYKDKDKYINARIQESIIRMSIASAKLRLSKLVEGKDLKIAVDIISKSYYDTPEYDYIYSQSNLMCARNKLRDNPDTFFSTSNLGISRNELLIMAKDGIIHEAKKDHWGWLG